MIRQSLLVQGDAAIACITYLGVPVSLTIASLCKCLFQSICSSPSMRPCMCVNILSICALAPISRWRSWGVTEMMPMSPVPNRLRSFVVDCGFAPYACTAPSSTAASRRKSRFRFASPLCKHKNKYLYYYYFHTIIGLRIEEIHGTAALLPLLGLACTLWTWTGASFGANGCRRFHDINEIHTYTYRNTNTSTYTYTYT